MDAWLDQPLYSGAITITGWKLIGWTGAGMFALRWVVQAVHRARSGSAVVPTVFWIISLIGAGMTTLYFVFGKNDSVGILQNALPAAVAAYNLAKDLRTPPVAAG